MPSSHFSHITDELLSAYIDGAVTDSERQQIEAAIAASTDVAWRLESLRHTVQLLNGLPPLALPRSFEVHEEAVAEVVQQRQARARSRSLQQATSSTHSARSHAQLQRDTGPRLNFWRSLWQLGNPMWRNAAAACAVLLLLLVVGEDFVTSVPSRLMQTGGQQATATVVNADGRPDDESVVSRTVPEVAQAAAQESDVAEISMEEASGADVPERAEDADTAEAAPSASAASALETENAAEAVAVAPRADAASPPANAGQMDASPGASEMSTLDELTTVAPAAAVDMTTNPNIPLVLSEQVTAAGVAPGADAATDDAPQAGDAIVSAAVAAPASSEMFTITATTTLISGTEAANTERQLAQLAVRSTSPVTESSTLYQARITETSVVSKGFTELAPAPSAGNDGSSNSEQADEAADEAAEPMDTVFPPVEGEGSTIEQEVVLADTQDSTAQVSAAQDRVAQRSVAQKPDSSPRGETTEAATQGATPSKMTSQVARTLMQGLQMVVGVLAIFFFLLWLRSRTNGVIRS